MTLKKLEEHGVNIFVLKAGNFRLYNLRKYKTEWGGKLQWIADVIAGTNIDMFEKVLVEHLELGAGAYFICAGMFDWQVEQDVEIATKSIAASKGRKRPWFGQAGQQPATPPTEARGREFRRWNGRFDVYSTR